MKTLPYFRHGLILISFIAVFLVVSCEKKDSGPEIAWLSGSYITYNYRSGVIYGFTAHVKFEVTDNTSGEIEISADYEGQGKSCKGFVEPGKVYEVIVICGISSTPKNSAVIIDCPTVNKPYKITTDVKTSVSGISIKEA